MAMVSKQLLCCNHNQLAQYPIIKWYIWKKYLGPKGKYFLAINYYINLSWFDKFIPAIFEKEHLIVN